MFLTCAENLPALRLPALAPAAAIAVNFLPDLMRSRGKLRSGGGKGTAVHAASFLRERRIVLESALLSRPRELRRILIHELFHFVWMRLANTARQAWREILLLEQGARAKGELGWSAESRKPAAGMVPLGAAKWRDYVCESFCDTAAWRYAGIANHDEFTLAARWKSRRSRFFDGLERRPLAL